MTVTALPQAQEKRSSKVWERVSAVLVAAVGIAAGIARSSSRPIGSHLRDHAYSIMGFGLVDSAAFTHSVFTGLLVTGISFLIFEWKVSDDGDAS